MADTKPDAEALLPCKLVVGGDQRMACEPGTCAARNKHGPEHSCRAALSKPSVAPDDEALMKRFGDTLHRFRTVPSDENHTQMREADEALRRRFAELRWQVDNWKGCKEQQQARAVKAEAKVQELEVALAKEAAGAKHNGALYDREKARAETAERALAECRDKTIDECAAEGGYFGGDEVRAAVIAAMTRQTPPGWKLVPETPTPDQLRAAASAFNEAPLHSLDGQTFTLSEWRAIISSFAVAPEAPK